MDEISNPYVPGAGLRPPELAGRDPEIAMFDRLLGRLEQGNAARNIMVKGLRGVGKTVLLNEFEDRARERDYGWAVEFFEVRRGEDFRKQIGGHAMAALRAISIKAKAKDALNRAAQFVKAFTVTPNEEGTVDFRLDFEGVLERSASGNIEKDLVDLFLEVGEAAQANGRAVIFLIDELHELEQGSLEALVAGLHRSGQKRLPLAVVGAGLPNLPRRLSRAKSYTERMFEYPDLGALEETAAREAKPALTALEDVAVKYEPGAVDEILDFSERFPFFLQAHAERTWNLAENNVITEEDAENAVPGVQAELDRDFFETRISDVTAPSNRRYLAALAELGDGPQLTSEIAKKVGYGSERSASPQRQAMIDQGLIWASEPKKVDFTVPRFADFMRRKYPLSSFPKPRR